MRMLRAIRKIKMVMDVDAMTSMYTRYLFQEKQTVYLESVVKDLQTSLSQLTNTAEIPKAYQKKESLPIHEVHKLVDHMEDVIHGVSEDTRSRKDSYPLILLVQGTKRLVEKLHSGSEGLIRNFTIET
jgi:uncharacterized protein (UPF0305 family)